MRVKLGNICKIATGKSNRQDAVINGLYPFFDRSGEIKTLNTFLFDNECIIYPGEGTSFYPRYYNGKYNLHQRCYTLFDFNSSINIKYIYYKLFQYNEYFLNHSVGTTVPSLRQEAFLNLDLDLPPRDIQDKIASILSNIDDQIERNNAMCKRLQDLAQSTYSRWFNQFEFPNEQGLPYKSNGGKFVFNQELNREIPIDWTVKSLKEVICESDKSSIQVGQAKENIGKYPFFTSGEDILFYADYFVDGAYCFLNTGGNADVKFFVGKSSYSTDTYCISANEFTYILNSYLQNIKPNMDKLFFSGSGLKHLQKDIFKAQKIALPNDKIVNQFNNIVIPIYTKKSQLYLENIRLNFLKEKLLPLLINGQLVV